MTHAQPDKHLASAEIASWLVQRGLEGASVDAMLNGFCDQVVSAGIPILRVNLTFSAYHPEFGAFAFRWQRDGGTAREGYERSEEVQQDWLDSPLYHLLKTDIPDLCISLVDPAEALDFPVFADFRNEGATGYFAAKILFSPFHGTYATDPADPSAGMIISFTRDGAQGFTEEDLALLRGLLPSLGLALKATSTHDMAQDLLRAYLGSDAGGRVLSGDLQRGSMDRIEAVILYFDLQGFTKLSEALPGPDIIAMLNDYFGAAVPAIHAQGGHVLKFMGDGLLAIFARDQVADAGLAAMQAIDEMQDALPKISARRQANGQQSTGFTVGVHAGEVLYGNIGASDRLDFTVIGSAVNTAARIAAMCSHVDQPIVISGAVAQPLLDRRTDLVSLGTYRLRGVAERQELFTID